MVLRYKFRTASLALIIAAVIVHLANASKRIVDQDLELSITTDSVQPFNPPCDATDLAAGSIEAEVDCDQIEEQVQVSFLLTPQQSEPPNTDYYATIYCFNETHHISTEKRNILNLLNKELRSNVSHLLTGSIICSLIGCYETFNPKTLDDKTYQIKTNNCSFPNMEAFVSPTFSQALSISTFTNHHITATTSSHPVSDPEKYTTLSLTPSIISSTNHLKTTTTSIPINNSKEHTNQLMMSLTPSQIISDSGRHTRLMIMIIFIPFLPLTIFIISLVFCTIALVRKRKMKKCLTNWRTGYGLQLKESQVITSAIDVSILGLSWNTSPSLSKKVHMPLHHQTEGRLTPMMNSWNPERASKSSTNQHLSDAELVATTNQNDFASDELLRQLLYVPSLIYAENQQMPIIDTSECDDLFGHPASINDQNKAFVNKIAKSQSMPLISDYVDPLVYSSSEAINGELSLVSNVGALFVGCMNPQSLQQPEVNGEMSSEHSEVTSTSRFNRNGYVLHQYQ